MQTLQCTCTRYTRRRAASLEHQGHANCATPSMSSDEDDTMPDPETLKRAERARLPGKAPSTQAGEFVREEIHHIREGKHGARSAKQAIAIGLSKARRAGVPLKPPKPGTTSEATRRKAEHEYVAGANPKRASPKRSRAGLSALKDEGPAAASPLALSRQAHKAAEKRSHPQRSAAAHRAARAKGPAVRSAAARKAARTRAQRAR